MNLFLRPTVIAGDAIENDFVVLHEDCDVGRTRLATEHSPAFWTCAISVPLAAAPVAQLTSSAPRAASARRWSGSTPALRTSIKLWHDSDDAAKGRFGRSEDD